MIEISAKKRLGEFSLSAEISDAGFMCLSGRNGSGKTSLFRAITGHLAMDEGFVRVGGTDVTRLPAERKGVVMVTPGSSIPHLEVDSHLRWGASLRGVRLDERRMTETKAALGIDFKGRARTLSLGMRERLSLATALLSSPKLILVDEAFSNLHDREGFIASYRRLTEEARVDVLFSTQTPEDGELADHLYTMTDGKTQRLK